MYAIEREFTLCRLTSVATFDRVDVLLFLGRLVGGFGTSISSSVADDGEVKIDL